MLYGLIRRHFFPLTAVPSKPTHPSLAASTPEECGQRDGNDAGGVDSGRGDKLEFCQQQIGYRFQNVQHLTAALTHASIATHRLASNERLEFLGDAILGMVVCDWLYREFPEYSEGDLTKIKSTVVSRRTCAQIAKQLQLDECLIVGRGVSRNRSFPKSMYSDVFEAVVGAIYLDGGHEAIRDRLHAWLADEVRMAVSGQSGGNHKSMLQHLAQRDLGSAPIYRLMAESGPDHSKSFQVVAVIGKQTFAPAWGRNKKEAEQRAAGNALAELENREIPFPDGSVPH